MSKLSAFKQQLTKLAGASVAKMDDIIIFTTVAGWIASSAAQIYGIATNKNYSREQKKYMINQEVFDAGTNIALYFGLTKSLTALSSKLVKTGKLAPRSIVDFMSKNKLLKYRGKFDFDLTKLKSFENSGLQGQFNAFKCFANVTAATIGGIISSNILTPIVRNHFAAHRQNKFKKQRFEMYKAQVPVAKVEPTGQIITPHHSFDDFRRQAMRI